MIRRWTRRTWQQVLVAVAVGAAALGGLVALLLQPEAVPVAPPAPAPPNDAAERHRLRLAQEELAAAAAELEQGYRLPTADARSEALATWLNGRGAR